MARTPAPLWALRELWNHKGRTLLVAQGMAWAVALAITPAAIIEGSRQQALERARESRTDLLQIGPATGAARGSAPLEPDLPDLHALAGPEAPLTALRLGDGWSRSVGRFWALGSDPAVQDLLDFEVLAGQLPPLDVVPRVAPIAVALELGLAEALAPVAGRPSAEAMVGAELTLVWSPRGGAAHPRAELLLPGEEVTRGGGTALPLRVAAVVSDGRRNRVDSFGYEKGRAMSDLVEDVLEMFGVAANPAPWLREGLGLYLPRVAVPGARLDWIVIRTDPLEVQPLSARVEAALVERGREVLLYTNPVLSILSSPELDSYLRLNRVLFALYIGIGLVVLANLLLLAGTRRRREIALRRVEGATRAGIFCQFLWEGIFIAITGLLLGVAAGAAIAEIRVALDPNVALGVALPWHATLEAGAWLGVGALIASAYPAWRATRFAPVALLRRGGAS